VIVQTKKSVQWAYRRWALYMYDVVVKKFAFAISSPDELLFKSGNVAHKHANKKHTDS